MPNRQRLHRARAAAAVALLWLAAAWAAPEATSADGRWRLAAAGTRLVLSDASGRAVKSFVAAPLGGGAASEVAAVLHAPARQSFVVAFATLPELWEISLDPGAEPIYHGMVHDFKMGEGIAEPGYLGARRTRLELPLRDALLDATGSYLLGRAPDTAGGRAVLHLVHLDVRRRIGRFEVDGDPDLARARLDTRGERAVIVVPDRRGGAPWVLDVRAVRPYAPVP